MLKEDFGRERAASVALRACYNPLMKECPLCGETMRLSVREVPDHIPGSGQGPARVTREWICPECDYFEEAETGEE